MGKECPYCRDTIHQKATKCKTCGEPFYSLGKALKYSPMLSAGVSIASVVVSILSVVIAIKEVQDRRRAVLRADKAEEYSANVTKISDAKEIGARDALREFAQRLPDESRQAILKDLQIKPGTSLEGWKNQALIRPLDTDLQRKLYMYDALKASD
jgi:hypothetical protein